MYLSGKYTTPQIMSVSGHHNEDVFWEYVKLSLDEKAEQLFLSSADGMFLIRIIKNGNFGLKSSYFVWVLF